MSKISSPSKYGNRQSPGKAQKQSSASPIAVFNSNKENTTPVNQRSRSNQRGETSDPLQYSKSDNFMNASVTPAQNKPDPNTGGVSSIFAQNDGDEEISLSLKAAARVKNGLQDMKMKMAQMKEQKERAEAEMLKELEEYNSRAK